jgi:ubiquinone/menaquinone biosynthesis C-methylase UbiE
MSLCQKKIKAPTTVWGKGKYEKIGSKLVVISELLCEGMDLKAGARVLDIATGHGNTAIAAARRECMVTGIDTEQTLLEMAAIRAEVESVEITFLEGKAEEIPSENNYFDYVVSTFGVQFSPNPIDVVQEIVRVCKPGGRIAFTNWKFEGFTEEFTKIIQSFSSAPSPYSPYIWGDKSALTEFFGSQVQWDVMETCTFYYRFPLIEDWFESFKSTYGPVIALMGTLSSERQMELTNKVNQVVAKHNIAINGSLVLPVTYLRAIADLW